MAVKSAPLPLRFNLTACRIDLVLGPVEEEGGVEAKYKGRSFNILIIKVLTKHMGQYFRLLNYDKKEYVDPWDLGGVAKLWEWSANNQCRILPLLLRKSDEGGGGDIQKEYQTAGRWAGDSVALVGDYDQSQDFARAEKEFTNISRQVAKDYNDFIGITDYKLKPKAYERKSKH